MLQVVIWYRYFSQECNRIHIAQASKLPSERSWKRLHLLGRSHEGTHNYSSVSNFEICETGGRQLINKGNDKSTSHLTNILWDKPDSRTHLPGNTDRQLSIRLKITYMLGNEAW